MIAASIPSVSQLVRHDRRHRAGVVAIGLCLSVPAGIFAGDRSAAGSLMSVGILAALMIPLLLWRSLPGSVVLLVVLAVSVEQYRYAIADTNLDAFTDRIPIFVSLNSGVGISGFYFNPAELLMTAVLLSSIIRGVAEHSLHRPRSALGGSILALVVCTYIALAVGLAAGGNSSVALWEARPFTYLALMYLLTTQLLSTRRALDMVLWALIVGSGFKAAQGVYIYFASRNVFPRPEALLAHEESFFFGLFILVTVALWLFGQRGRMRTTATWLLPLVLVADAANARRLAWLILGAGLIVMLILAYVALPDRRQLIRRIGATTIIVSAVYMPVFWNSTSSLAEPVRAVRSVISPDPRDASSNEYRIREDANLGLNIKDSPMVGKGMGVPIDYRIPIVDVSGVDSFIKYITHDGVLYVWMRMGIAGELALWSMVAAGVIIGCRLLRSRDRGTAMIGAIGTCGVIIYMIMGYNDMGLYWFRMAMVMGCLLGLMEAARRREAAARQATTVVEEAGVAVAA